MTEQQSKLFPDPPRMWAHEQRRHSRPSRRRHDGRGRHANSLAAHADQEARLTRRALEILAWMVVQGRSLTDREVRDGYAPGEDMDYVRPRITELTDAGWLEPDGKVLDPQTLVNVRRSRATAAGVSFIANGGRMSPDQISTADKTEGMQS